MLHQFAVYVKHTRTNTKLIPLPIVNSACLHQHRTKFGESQSVCTSTIPLPFTSPELYTQHHGKADLPKLNRWCQHRLYCGAARRRDEIAIPESKIKQIPGAQYANTALQHYEHTKRAYRKSHPLNGGPPPYSNVDCHPFAALGETPLLNRRSLLD